MVYDPTEAYLWKCVDECALAEVTDYISKAVLESLRKRYLKNNRKLDV